MSSSAIGSLQPSAETRGSCLAVGERAAAIGGVSPDAVEVALAAALQRAAAAAQWSTVELLARELQARREARETREAVTR